MIDLRHFVVSTFTHLSAPKRWMMRGAVLLLLAGGGAQLASAAGAIDGGGWSWASLQSGLGFVGGFLLGALVRLFLKLSLLVTALVAAVGFGLTKLGFVEGAELGEWARSVGDAARAQAGDAQRFVSGFLPASVSSGLGVASGVTQRPDLTPDDDE
ncbi:MAG: hypothetical protein AAFU73_13895 [Planctomycetota bacterium]